MNYMMSLLLLFLLSSVDGKTQYPFNDKSLAPLVVSKPSLNIDSLKNWEEVTFLQINSNGKYCGYVIEQNQSNEKRLVLMGTQVKWKIESTIKGYYSLTSKTDKAIWINSNDTLCVVTLGGLDIHYVPNVSSFWISDDYLICQPKIGRMIMLNLNRNLRQEQMKEKSTIVMDTRSMKLLLQRDDQGSKLLLKSKRRKKIIWNGGAIGNIVKDNEKGQVAFVFEDELNRICYYKKGIDSVTYLNVPSDSTYAFEGLSNFSKNGEYLFLDLRERNPTLPRMESVVNVWSYTDSKLQRQQVMEQSERRYKGIIRLSDHYFFRLDSGNDWLFLPQIQDSVALIRQQNVTTPADEIDWNIHSQFFWYLISMKSNCRIELDDLKKNRIVQLSPSGKYVIYYDGEKKNYFVYETQNGYKRCLTKGISENWLKTNDDVGYGQYIAAWGKDDAFVLLNGRRDIWQIDPSGIAFPINLTAGYGNKHNVMFFLALDEYAHRAISQNESLLLNAFNLDTKENGFYRTTIGRSDRFDSLIMSPYVYDIKDNPSIPSGINYAPLKASNSNKFIVRRMSANESPNFFFTKNFRTFSPLSDIQPQKLYNWYRTELHEWKSLDGSRLQGVLYKPDNFDSTKKYPVIFHYYERKSDALNVYIKPNVLDNGCEINIPYYVSSGYLVFCPDIKYRIGDPMQGTYDAIISAVRYILTFPFVDPRKIGAQGCSWGGIQTTYVVTHTNLFAAACSASGIGNWVSDYGSLSGTGESMQGMFENGQFRIGGTLWEKREAYIRSSPIFRVNLVTTPLLLMHTREDMICNLSNIQGFFWSLCQAKRKSWFLLYDGNHGVYGKDGEDFSSRMKQFFDYFLRDYPAPEWMTSSARKY
ncbi:alpha/beta hydrolase family protein [Chitinophaga arvensicola]|uniref:Dipeptidyl aminopeptidase/acylaminoacyl peptidase n=1 Tax=Chitinophaga arvensicola TaxID=29529 RepID=A0A1I0SBD8_9BACT|nr:prolyl oligopeptidase family serine peptidase [Chitinophaga arvensicola]SEW53929.1 Dipeptidyl aminopeptidase/acylaminoacyl peptidase [Chitinophaga arvensicola]